jgi:hypothetical protein
VWLSAPSRAALTHEHLHLEVFFAIAAHTVPVVALLVQAFVPVWGRTVAFFQGLALGLSGVLGVARGRGRERDGGGDADPVHHRVRGGALDPRGLARPQRRVACARVPRGWWTCWR